MRRTPVARVAGLALLTMSLVAVAGCDHDTESSSWFSRGDARTVSVSAGDAELDASGRLNFEVTSDVYRRWMIAQQALGKSDLSRSVAQLGRRALTQRELDRAVARVQGDANARAAIEGAGMTPLEYVYATVAIEQAMAVASGRLAPRKGDAGVPPQNVEIVGQHQDEIMAGGVIGDTSVIVLPEAPPATIETLPPAPPRESLPPALPPPEPSPPVDTGRPRAEPREPPPAPVPPAQTVPSPVPAPPADPAPTPSPPPPSGRAPSSAAP